MNTHKRFKHKDKDIEHEVNMIQDALVGTCQSAIGWWTLLGKYINSLSGENRKIVQKYLFEMIEDLDEEMTQDLTVMEEKYFKSND